VHHGYERPGYGHIVGDCFGVHRLPHETSPDLAKDYCGVLEAHLKALVARTARVESAAELTHTHIEGRRETRQEVPVTVRKGDRTRYEGMHTIPSFDSLQQSMLREIARETDAVERDIQRLTNLIATWTEQPLTTVEEETAKGHSEAQAKRDEKQAARDLKTAEKAKRDAARAASAQAKIDKAVAKCLPLLDAVDPTDVEAVRKAYLAVLQLSLPITETQRWGFFENLPESHKATLKAAGLFTPHNGMLFSWPEEIYRMTPVKK
jgi:hypothetical protein